MDAAKIRILIEADSSGVARGLAGATAAVTTFERAATSSFRHVTTALSALGRGDIAGFTSSIGALTSSLTTGQKAFIAVGAGVAVLTAGLTATIGPAIRFESAFAGVRKTVDGTPDQLDQIRSALLGMAREMPTTAAELALIAESAGQLGVAAPDIAKFTQVIAQLGETTDLSFDQAATQMARFLLVTDGGVGEVDAFSNSLVALGNAGASTESEILAMSLRMASAMTMAGATKSEIAALAEATTSMGMGAEAGGTALSRIITKIADAARDGGPILDTFAGTAGLLPDEFARIAKESPVEALLLFTEGLARVNAAGGSTTPILRDVGLSAVYTSQVLRNMALNTDYVRQQMDLSNSAMLEGSARADEYGKRVETTASRLDIFRNRLEVIAIALGTPALDTFAAGVDAAGDAIEAIVAALAPMAPAIRDALGNGASLASALWDALGGPAASMAIAALTGATQAATGLLTVLNATGPAGFAIGGLLATLALYPPAMAAARAATLAFAISLASVGPAGTAAAVGASAASLALAAGPWIVVAGLLAAVGKGFIDAGNSARTAGQQFTEAISGAVGSGDYERLAGELAKIRDRQNELAALSTSDNWLSRLGIAARSTLEQLTPFNNTILQSQAELKLLDQLMIDNNWSTYEASIVGTAAVLGMSTDRTVELASSMGLLEVITGGTSEQMHAARDAMQLALNATAALSQETGIAADRLLNGSMGAGEFARALGLTAEQLRFVADGIEGVDFKVLFSDDVEAKAIAMVQLFDEIQGRFAPLAAQIGITTGQYIEQIKAVQDLSATYDKLQSAIDGTIDALSKINAQQQNAAASAADFEAALQGMDGSMASLATAAAAGRQALLDFAGTAPSFAEFEAQQAAVAQQFYATAVAAGYGRDVVMQYLTELLRIPPAVASEIILLAQQAKDDADAVRTQLENLTAQEWRALLAVDPSLALEMTEKTRIELLDLTTAEWLATLTADDTPALATIANASVRARDYALDQYQASLTAESGQADSTISRTQSTARTYADGIYTASITARDNASNTIAVPQSHASRYATSYDATLTARDNASSVIAGAVGALNRFTDKTITITTVNRTVNQSSFVRPLADGGILRYADGGIQRFANGGENHQAMIAPGRWPARVWAEPETGGEAYIPLAVSKRARSTSILDTVAREFGYQLVPTMAMAHGGIARAATATAVSRARIDARTIITMPVTIENAAGLDTGEVADLVTRKVTDALRAQARDLRNIRGLGL
jgi:TP901 family phage tail tape measure protein